MRIAGATPANVRPSHPRAVEVQLDAHLETTMSSLRSWVAVAGLLVSLGAPAVSSADTGGWLNRTTVTRVVVHDWQTSIWVYFADPQPNPAGCTSTAFVVIKPSHAFFKELYASALAASMSGTSVGGWVYGCDPDFHVPVLTRFELLPNPNVTYP
jgi:hypothetical protein